MFLPIFYFDKCDISTYVTFSFAIACVNMVLITMWMHYLMVSYITNARFWIHFLGNRVYVTWKDKKILLSPVDDWIHDSIWNWTQDWYPALITSTIQTSLHKIIYCYVKWWDGHSNLNPDPRWKVESGNLTNDSKRRWYQVYRFPNIFT